MRKAIPGYAQRLQGWTRPGLKNLLDFVRPGDTVVVWKLDRLGRSLQDLIAIVTDLEQRGIGGKSLQEHLDTTTPGGRLVFPRFGTLAECERGIIRERTTARRLRREDPVNKPRWSGAF